MFVRSLRYRIWIPAFVGLLLSLTHAWFLPMFAGFDEPAHLSSLLSFATGEGRPRHEVAHFHATVEKAMPLVPAPIHQLRGWREKIGGYSYVEWSQLSAEKKTELNNQLVALEVHGWQDSDYFINWQSQHPPLYYWGLGTLMGLSGIQNYVALHNFTRLMSAAIFASTFFIITYFLVIKWSYPLSTIWWIIFLPMLYTLGARISTDALTIPLFSLTILAILNELKKNPSQWALKPWLICGVYAAATLGAKAYPLLLIPVMGVVGLWSGSQFGNTLRERIKYFCYPLIPIVVMLTLWSWWLYENFQRTGSVTGQAELVTLKQQGLNTLGAQLKAVGELYTTLLPQTLLVWGGVFAHILFVANWLVGLAPPFFYLLQALVYLVPPLLVLRFSKQTFKQSEALFFFLILASFAYGYFKFIVDFYLYFGKPTWVGGWYCWGAVAALAAFMALVFSKLSSRITKVFVLLQALCFAIAMLTNLMYFSGLYERHPVWKYPVRVQR